MLALMAAVAPVAAQVPAAPSDAPVAAQVPAAPSDAPRPVIALHGAETGRLSLVDQGQLWIERAEKPPRDGPARWRPVDRAALTPGYTRDTYWLRWILRQDGATPMRYVLMVDPARIESIALFRRRLLPDGNATPWTMARAGTDLPFAARQVPLRESAFPVRLEPGEVWELQLRVASRSSLAIEPSLWTEEALVGEQQWRVWRDGMLSAVGLTLAVLAAGLGVALRDRGYGWIAAFLSSAMLYEMAMRGTAFARFWPNATDWAQRALGTTGALTTVFQLLALATVLRLRVTQPRLNRVLMVVVGLSFAAVAACIWADYQIGTRLAGPTNLGLSLIGLIASVRAVRRGDPVGGVWLCAIVGVMLGMAPRYFSLMGVLPYADWVELAPSAVGTAGAAAVLVAMLLLLQRERVQRAQALEAAVLERTAELARASAHAQASDAAKGRLLGHLGHDLRAPLASMVQLTRRLAPGAEFESTRQALEHGGVMLLDTIDELQRFARQPDAEADLEVLAAPVYLYGLLNELALQSQALMLASTNRLVVTVEPTLPPVVELDARRLRQVLLNLLSNAAKYSRPGEILLTARAIEGRLVLSVIDQGPGMAPEELARVFDPFMRGEAGRGVPGLGLGLAIARQTVRAMGGELGAYSVHGVGSRFTAELPLVAADEGQVQWPALLPQPGLESIGEGWAAVVWDRCDTVREALLERLLQCGFEAGAVERIEDLPRALDDAAATGAGLLLVASPESLPSIDDWRRWRARWPGMRTLLCAATSNREWPSEPGLAMLPKPAPQELWVPALRMLCLGVDAGS
ncbi:sensor histidine kinase [Roseateles aquatilis]|uniref:sensor histidine kinase n=1 Tax=Roseateles aquatilis TaxID=431061 RepID=UPI0011322D74|nr:sensor histidine kinase [Roseateles aquatilis]